MQRGLTDADARGGGRAGDVQRMQAWAGQAAALARPEPAGEIVRRLWDEAQALLPYRRRIGPRRRCTSGILRPARRRSGASTFRQYFRAYRADAHDLITDSDALAAFCARQHGVEFVTVDTEFMRERTYWPILCLVQVAGPEEAVAIDALAEGIDLAPLLALMADPATLKVFHAARQDLEIFFQLSGAGAAPGVRHPDRRDGVRLWRCGQLRDPGQAARRRRASTRPRALPTGRTGR